MKQMKRIMSAALVGIMALAGASAVSAQDTAGVPVVLAETGEAKSPALSISKEKADGSMKVTLGWSGQNLCSFDYAILYDTSKVEVSESALNPEFLEKYNAQEGDTQQGGVSDHEDMGGYVVLGGVYANGDSDEGERYTGGLVTITLLPKEGADGYGILKIVKSGSKYDGLEALQNAAAMQTINLDQDYLKGDADLSGFVDTDDAVAILMHSVGISELSGDAYNAANVNNDAAVDTDDAVLILRYIVGLETEW